MAKRLKKVLCFVVPFVVAVAITLGVILPCAFGKQNPGDVVQKNVFEENMVGATETSSSLTTRASDSGASTADISKKGGAIYLEPYAIYTMSGGTISGGSNTYGGAVFVSSGATFTMEGGTIKNCSAEYGGAIYISSGATCTITGGTITGCKAENGPAIYIETGGNLIVDPSTKISDNDVYYDVSFEIGAEERMGGTYDGVQSSVKLKTVYFGTFPQTYVGNTLNSRLESWWTSNKPVVQTYTIRDQIWKSYLYTDGSIYARGSSKVYESDYTYKDGTTAKTTGTTVWFKVEPIKWHIMNYDAWKAGREKIELLSVLAISSGIRFGSSNNWAGSMLQGWLNDNFYKTAFTTAEQSHIVKTENKNGITNQYNISPSQWTGTTTQDNIYLKTYYEMGHDMFSTSSTAGNGNAARLCSSTDFAISNNCYLNISYSAGYGKGTPFWWLRSAGSAAANACFVLSNGNLNTDDSIGDCFAIRPALHLNIAAQ